MYTSSSQLNKWTFSSEEDVLKKHVCANRKHTDKFGKGGVEDPETFFLSVDEEQVLVHHYEQVLYDFCCNLKPKVPRYVINTAFHYFKRFYLTTSVMDHHPKEILVTCVYLAAKIEEFYLPLMQVIANVDGDQEKAEKIILDKELLLLEQMEFDLLVHHPFRPIEGFLIDMKTQNGFPLPERLRPGVKEFLKKHLLTDAYLLYSPTQLALAALTYAAQLINESIQPYLDILLKDCSDKDKENLTERIQKILEMKHAKPLPPREVIEVLKMRLENCRNKVHKFGTEEYVAYSEAKCLSFDEDERNCITFSFSLNLPLTLQDSESI